MTDKNSLTDNELDALFRQAANEPADIAPDFLARIMADADAVLDAGRATPPVAAGPSLGGLWRLLGGWPGFAGLTTATVAGVWIGFAPPAAITDITGSGLLGLTTSSVADLMPSIDYALNES